MFELNNKIRDYQWGSTNQISELLGLDDPTSPQAELWIGAHPGCPSRLAGSTQGLDQAIALDPETLLGADVARRYGRLPFLFKVLSAAGPLSIQVHPTLEQAKARFAQENAAGIKLDAPERNYRDDNHKPEMLYALTDFVALSGFRTSAEIVADLKSLTELLDPTPRAWIEQLISLLQGIDPLASALGYVLGGTFDPVLLVNSLCRAIAEHEHLHSLEHFAELLSINTMYPGDAGVLVALLLNRVVLKPGQAISLAAGNVHAYLRGLGIEVMANSDNVLRGGLTAKHIDVPELLDVMIAQPAPAPILAPLELASGNQMYRPAFDEFQLQVLEPSVAGQRTELELHGAGIVLCTAGTFLLQTQQSELRIERGQSVFVSAAELPASATSVGAQGAQLFAASAQSH